MTHFWGEGEKTWPGQLGGALSVGSFSAASSEKQFSLEQTSGKRGVVCDFEAKRGVGELVLVLCLKQALGGGSLQERGGMWCAGE